MTWQRLFDYIGFGFFTKTLIVLILIGIFVMLARSFWKRNIEPSWNDVRQFLDDWNGRDERPHISPRIPGVMERLAMVENDVNEIKEQLKDKVAEAVKEVIAS